jgi:hypothetical protein
MSSEVIGMLFRPLRRPRGDGDVREAEHPFDGRPLADIIPFDRMAGVLQQVTQNKRRSSPIPGQEKEQKYAGDGQRNSEQVDREVERMLVPLAPIAQGFAQEIQNWVS